MLDQTARIGGVAPDVTLTIRRIKLERQATLHSLELRRSARSGTTVLRPIHQSPTA